MSPVLLICEVQHLGIVSYVEALQLQNRLCADRRQGVIADQFVLLEHPHTYTLGSAAKREHLLLTPEQCAAAAITVCTADRGGDITYHGPGQLVGYPIMQLSSGDQSRRDVVDYVRKLEQVITAVLADFAIIAFTLKGFTGVWVGAPDAPEKICAIGVRVDANGITKHGFALNVSTDLRYFEGIVPCGIADKGVTSMAHVLGAPPAMAAVQSRVAYHFGRVFARSMVEIVNLQFDTSTKSPLQ